MSELLSRARSVFTTLELLAEGQTAALDADRVAHSSSESRPPPPVDPLREKYLRRLENLCTDAEADLARFKFPTPSRDGETDDQFATRIVHQWTGHDVRLVAKLEGQHQTVIKRARTLFGRDPIYGLPRGGGN